MENHGKNRAQTFIYHHVYLLQNIEFTGFASNQKVKSLPYELSLT